MNAKVSLYICFNLKHIDSEHCVPNQVAKKTAHQDIVVELPENFVEIMGLFDKGTTKLEVTVSGKREILPGEDTSI